MTVTEYSVHHSIGTSVWTRLRRYLRMARIMMRRRRRFVRTHIELSRLDDRLLYDLGLDPLDVRNALDDHRSRASLSLLARRRRQPGQEA